MVRVIFCVLLAWFVLSLVLFARVHRAPNLGHPVRGWRWLNRFLAYPVCHFLALMPVMGLIAGIGELTPLDMTPASHPTLAWLQLVVLPVPVALLLMKLKMWLQRAWLGYEQWPPPPPAPPMPEAWVPPLPRRHDFTGLDLRDPELVRELARSHWRVAQEALEQGSSTEVAEDLHRRFLVDHLGTVEHELAAQAHAVYCNEMADQASAAQANAERIEALREHQLRVLTWTEADGEKARP